MSSPERPTLRRLVCQDEPGSPTVEFFYEDTDEMLAMVRDCIERSCVRVTITRCTCGRTCCSIHKTHTEPHMGCILR